ALVIRKSLKIDGEGLSVRLDSFDLEGARHITGDRDDRRGCRAVRNSLSDLITRPDNEGALSFAAEFLGIFDDHTHRKDEFWHLRVIGGDCRVLGNRSAVPACPDKQSHLALLPGRNRAGKVRRRATAAGHYTAYL